MQTPILYSYPSRNLDGLYLRLMSDYLEVEPVIFQGGFVLFRAIVDFLLILSVSSPSD